ncbi:condensation domain-containing protein [Desulfoluna butyratoxydans]|uniref:Condensation domain n=1 Tax=Desulfoluna butyratoxydans TaxID=231438 RepID=A0A4U8YW85_9BACT|nr:condensation domain-containing protein [Desulfoluna butyratoxydans]VFQ46272.1 condensation domain [Desulfoluna butyratoxydans]
MVSHEIARTIEDIYDLTDVQGRILNECLEAPGVGVHRMDLVFDYRGTVDEALFARSWEHIIRNHVCFRTSFHARDLDRPLQVVRNDTRFVYGTVDLRNMEPREREAAFRRLVEEDRKTDFVLEKAPLMRLDLVREEAEAFKLWWRFPEILMDGWNIPIVIREFLEAYRALYVDGREPDNPVTYPYRDYVAWLKQRDLDREEAFWKEYLKGARLESASTGGADREPSGRWERLDLGIAHLFDGLTQWAREHEITLNALFQGIFFLAMDSGALDLTMGATLADRPLALENAQERVGLYLNTLPVRCRCDAETSFVDMARRFHREMMALFEVSSSSDRQIRQWCGLPVDTPLYDCMFIFENMPVHEDNYDGLGFHLTGYNFENRPSAPLNLFVWPGKEMNLKVMHDTGLYTSREAKALLEAMEAMLSALVDSGDMPVAALKQIGGR